MIRLERTDSTNIDFHELVRLLDEGLRVTDGNEFGFFAQFNKIDAIKNVVLAYDGELAVGCGAFKEYATDTVEIKRMFVRHESRGHGVAMKILIELEAWAGELGFTESILETGNMLVSAIRLYERSGYRHIPKYGQYTDVETSVCMAKNIKQ